MNVGLAVLYALVFFSTQGRCDNVFLTFKTEPTFRSPLINVLVNNGTDRVAPGYIFSSPISNHFREGLGFGGYGPMIYTTDGELVWNGNASTYHRAIRMRPCNILGGNREHLCWHDGPTSNPTYNRGVLRVFDNTYTQVGADFGKVGGLDVPDGHEINTTPDGKAMLQDVFYKKKVRMPTMFGWREWWALDCCIQEVDIVTRNVLFQWCLSDHLPIADRGAELPDQTWWRRQWYGGTGQDKFHPMDLWHINSIDKNLFGDYIISVRHLNTVIKIAGNNSTSGKPAGTILWRLGGDHNDFQKNFKFSRQHVAHFVESTPDRTVIVLLNNAFAGREGTETSKESHGMVIAIDTKEMRARVLQRYPQPNHMLTQSAGNIQWLPNGNIFIGWGHLPFWSEYANDGTLLYYANLALVGGTSPQIWKFPWVGRPKTSPKILPYSKSCIIDSPMMVYASWNGATEVKDWKVYASNSSSSGPWTEVGTFPKAGFETAMKLPTGFAAYIYADALDGNGMTLGTSLPTETFVPNEALTESCNESGCKSLQGYDVSFSEGLLNPNNVSYAFDYDRVWSDVGKCGVQRAMGGWSAIACLFIFALVEWSALFEQSFVPAAVLTSLPSVRRIRRGRNVVVAYD